MKPLNDWTSLFECRQSTTTSLRFTKIHSNIYKSVAWLIFLLLSACGQTPIQQQLSHPDWQVSGKIGIRESLLKGASASFQWSQQRDDYIIHMFNSLSQPILTLKGNQKNASLSTADGKHYHADSAETLMQQISGWSFPVDAVKFWLQGQLYGNEQALEYNSLGQLIAFSTPVWQVTVDKYKNVGGSMLPHRLKLIKPDLRLTIIIKQHQQTSL